MMWIMLIEYGAELYDC